MRDEFKNRIKTFCQSFADLPEEEILPFINEVSAVTLKTGEFFTKEGDAGDRLGFLISGLFRVYYKSPSGKIHIRNFISEDQLLGSYSTILAQKPAHVYIEALEPSIVAEFYHKDIVKRLNTHLGWERLTRLAAQRYYLSRERREYCLLTMDARERYQEFLREFPGLENRVTQANIASYINVTPETLSRIRN